MKLEDILMKMNKIEYGFNTTTEDYKLQSPEELLISNKGICWDQVELARYYLEQNGYKCESFFIFAKDDINIQTHTFLVVVDNNKYYWFEHSFEPYEGIHEYNDYQLLMDDVINKFIMSLSFKLADLKVFKYQKPKYGISADEFLDFCFNGEEI